MTMAMNHAAAPNPSPAPPSPRLPPSSFAIPYTVSPRPATAKGSAMARKTAYSAKLGVPSVPHRPAPLHRECTHISPQHIDHQAGGEPVDPPDDGWNVIGGHREDQQPKDRRVPTGREPCTRIHGLWKAHATADVGRSSNQPA